MILTTAMMLAAETAAGAPLDTYAWAKVGGSFICLVALVMGANAVDDFLDRRKTKVGSPPNEQLQSSHSDLERRVGVLEETIVSKEWFNKIESDLETLRTEANTHRESKDKTDSIHRASLYKAIDACRSDTSNHIENVRRELSDNQRSLPNEIVTLLKNTNAI